MRPLTTTHPIGEIGSFPFSVQRHDGSAKVLLQGRAEHEAHISENALGTVASVERALSGIEARLATREKDLRKYRTKREDLGRHLDAPFEAQDRPRPAADRLREN